MAEQFHFVRLCRTAPCRIPNFFAVYAEFILVAMDKADDVAPVLPQNQGSQEKRQEHDDRIRIEIPSGKGKLAPAQTDPRDTYFVSRNKSRNPTQTTRPIRQSIIQTMVPPERMPLPRP